jgi:hypothetical protein
MSEITIKRIGEICQKAGRKEDELWDLFIDTRSNLRPRYRGTECILRAVEEVAKQLQIERSEARALYNFLERKFIG